MRSDYEDNLREGVQRAETEVRQGATVVRKAFYENWRVSAALGAIAGAAAVLLLQAIF